MNFVVASDYAQGSMWCESNSYGKSKLILPKVGFWSIIGPRFLKYYQANDTCSSHIESPFIINLRCVQIIERDTTL